MEGRIGLYGGSFDPIHHGHLIIARCVAESLKLDRVILLPSANPPNKSGHTLALAAHRREMVRLAIEGDPLFDCDDYDLIRQGPSYTVDTVTHFRQTVGPDAELYWIIGADSLADLPTWRNLSGILDQCEVVTAHRPGAPLPDWTRLASIIGVERVDRLRASVLSTPAIAISSTDIRRRIAAGLSCRYLVPEVVCRYVAQNGLYRIAQ